MSAVSKAFQRAHREKKATNAFDTILQTIDGAFKTAIPEAVLEMPRTAMYTIGIASYVTCFAVFIIIVLSTYNENIAQVYLSPNFIEGQCDVVSTSVSGTYLADSNGNWQSSSAFKPTEAVYSFTTQDLVASDVTYYNILTSLNDAITFEAMIMPNNTLTGNIIIWTSWMSTFVSNGTLQYFNLYGDPGVIFNRQYLLGTISNVDADCNSSSVVTFSQSDYLVTLSYGYNEFTSDPSCSNVISPEQLGYNPLYDGDSITMSLDMRSFVTAIAINEGVMLLPQLEELDGTTFTFVNDGINYNVSNYYDVRYPGMTPIYCAINLNSEWQTIDGNGELLVLYNTSCGIEFPNQTYSIPLFNHFGYSNDYPSYCACNNGSGPGATDANCDVFNFMVGVLLYSNTDNANFQNGNPFIDVQNKVPIVDMNPAAYDAMYMAVSSHYTDAYQNPATREAAYSFCNVSYASCTIVTVNMYDDANSAVTDYYHQLLKGSCADSISIPTAAYNKLKTTPPAPLQESYYNCRQASSTVLSSAVGIGSGNMGALIPVIFICFIQAYYFYLSMKGKKAKVTYSKEERDDALQGLAVQLLMERDGRFPATRKPRRNGTLLRASTGNCIAPGGGSAEVGSGSGSGGVECLPPNISVLRLLTEELMENAYISTYFDESDTDGGERGTSAGAHSASARVSNPMTVGVSDEDVELAAVGTRTVEGKVEILNQIVDEAADTVVAFAKVRAGDPGDIVRQAEQLLPLLDTLTRRMVATTTAPEIAAGLSEVDREDFWSLVLHTAVLHDLDLRALKVAARTGSPEVVSRAYSVYVRLLMKIYEVANWHVRIGYSCSADNMDRHRQSKGYRIGPLVYSLAQLEGEYNGALEHATAAGISLNLS